MDISLDELSELVNKVKTFPIDKLESEINRIDELLKVTKKQKYVDKYKKQLKLLNEFKVIYEVMNKE